MAIAKQANAEFLVERDYETDRRSAGSWILSYVKRNRLLVIGIVIGAAGNAYLATFVPIFIGVAFDAVLQSPPDLSAVGRAALLIILSQVVRAVLQLGRNFFSEMLGQRIERDSREELYISLLGKSMAFHDSHAVGDTMARATNDVREMGLMFAPGFNLVIGSGFFLLAPILITPTLDPALTFAPLFFLVTYAIALIFYLRTLRPIADNVRETFGRLNGRLAEALDGIEVVKGASAEQEEIDHFEENAADYRDAIITQGRVEARFLPLLLLGITTAIGLTHAITIYTNDPTRISVGDIVAYMGLLAMFGFPVFVSLVSYAQVARGFAGARRVLELIKTETALDENKAGYQGEIEGGIEFETVSFQYVEGNTILEKVNISVRPGETVALVGQTGSGKSSLVKLINRTYDATEGCVKIDGRNVRDWDLGTLRRQISIIEQDIFLFSRTIRENISFGKLDATEEEIVTAAKAAQAHDFILTFEDGYDTVIGERGVTLSGGQRQRLALARAFVTHPKILILDDSTSAVDSATEDKIQRAISLAASRQTTILITHRLSQIRWADQVVVLRNGRVIGAGKHEELMASEPSYRRIFSG